MEVSDPPSLLHLKLCLRSLGETLEHGAHLLLPDEKHGKYRSFFAFLIHSPTSIRLVILTYSQPGQHLCYELWPCRDPCWPSRSWPSISVVCKVINFFQDFITNISSKSHEWKKGLIDSTKSPVQEIFGSVGVPHMIAETV